MWKNNILKNVFLLTTFCAPLYLLKISFGGIPLNALDALFIFAIIFFVLEKRKELYSKLADIPKLLILSSALIIIGLLTSILFNGNYAIGFGILKSWFVLPMLFSLALYLSIDSLQDVENIFLIIFFSTTAVGLVAMCYKIFGIVTYDNRLTAFYLSPNYLAMYLAPGVFFGIFFLLNSFSQKKYSWNFLFYFFCLIIILASLYFTYSYGTWVAVLLPLAATIPIYLLSKKYLSVIFILLIFAAALLFVFQLDTQKFSSLEQLSSRSSLASRITIWQVSGLLIKKHPIFGIGPGDFQTAYLSQQPFFPPYLEWAVPEPHNIFLAFYLEAGIVGLAGFLLLLFFIFITIWKILQNKNASTLAAPLIAYFIYALLHGMVDTTYWKNDLALIFWICLSMILALQFYSKKSSSNNFRNNFQLE